ncbi:MAG: hypothetical protein K5879_08760 [Lachnospiraceae bacterium]|nr:hypothetical protein [Lachnospiraceae bacterium]
MSNSFFLPKGTEGRKKNIMILHIQGLILIVVLIMALMSSLGILGRTILTEIVFRTGLIDTGIDLMSVMQSGNFFDAATLTPQYSPSAKLFLTGMKIWGVVGYITAFAALGAVIFLVIQMKKRIAMIVEDPYQMENPIRVKKSAFVWLGFLLGAYGGHLFALKKKKAWIYLGLGIVGMWIPVFFLYTSGISFADAFLACFIEKDANGYIEMEDYPYWL